MKHTLPGKTLILFLLLSNTVFLHSQESTLKRGVLPQDSKCPTLIVTPENQNVTSSSGTTGFSVTSNVSWTAISSQAWCNVTPSGTGDGTITAAYQSNPEAGSRTATITVSGPEVSDQVVTVTQLGTSPALIVTPLNRNVASSSGTTGFDVASNVAWTSSSDQAWCTVTPSGTGNGTITAAFQSNSGDGPRTATITVSGQGVSDQVVTVTQLGTSPSLTVSPLNQNVTSASGTTRFEVATNVDWTAACDQPWCTVTSSGSGNGTIIATYTANSETGSRTALITVTGQGVSKTEVTVTQSGVPPSLVVTPLNQDVTSAAGTTGFEVNANITWTASSNQQWCTVTPAGTGNGTITATYTEHSETGARTAAITVSGPGVSDQVVTITQSGVPSSLIVTPLNQNVTSSPGTATFNVASNIDWTTSCDQPWCTVTPAGNGNGTITASYQANTGPSSRITTITVSGPGVNDQVVTLTQDELITISYSGSPWCPSEEVKDVTLSGTPGGTYSAQPAGLDLNPATGAITPGNSAAGSYIVKYTLEKTGENRVLEASAQVEIYPGLDPQIVIKWDDVLICSNVGNLFFGYQWFNGENPIPGANDQYYVTSKAPGIYSVEAVDKNGCKSMSNEISIGSSKSFVVYPNPAHGSFKISINDRPVGDTRIRIINASGTEVMNLKTEKSDSEFFREISTVNLEKGYYFVQVIVGDVYFYNVKIMVIK
jgi:hypothetical protein